MFEASHPRVRGSLADRPAEWNLPGDHGGSMDQPFPPCISLPARRGTPHRERVHPAPIPQITVIRGQGRWAGTLYSFSMQGVGLVLDAQFERGVMLGVELTRRSRFFSSPRMLRVGRVRPRPDGTYLVECQFCYPLAFDQLYDLV